MTGVQTCALPISALAPSRGWYGLPAAPQQLAAYLAAAERQAAARLERQLLSAPPSLAQLLASISAAEATHVPVLTARQAG